MRVWVKICGIRRVADALAAVEAGADAIGINFYQGSKRYCGDQAARLIVAALPPGFPVYGVFVDAGPERISEVVEATGIGGIQLHGDEPEETARAWGLPVIRAVRAGSAKAAGKAVAEAEAAGQAYRLLLDSALGGGSGVRIAKEALTGVSLTEAIVAGGLTPANVAAIVAGLRPFGVDCAGGVESAPGEKDADLMREFVSNARSSNG